MQTATVWAQTATAKRSLSYNSLDFQQALFALLRVQNVSPFSFMHLFGSWCDRLWWSHDLLLSWKVSEHRVVFRNSAIDLAGYMHYWLHFPVWGFIPIRWMTIFPWHHGRPSQTPLVFSQLCLESRIEPTLAQRPVSWSKIWILQLSVFQEVTYTRAAAEI